MWEKANCSLFHPDPQRPLEIFFTCALIASTLPKEKNVIEESKTLKDVKVKDEARFMNDWHKMPLSSERLIGIVL